MNDASSKIGTIPIPPPGQTSRIATIDVARGIAVLGIFTINLPDMAYPEDLVLYPGPPGVTGGIDRWILFLSEVFFSGKMRGLFACIFGISATLLVEKLIQIYI